MVHRDRHRVDYTSVAGLMSPVPEQRGQALLELLHNATAVGVGHFTALDARGRHVVVARLEGAPRPVAPAGSGTVIWLLSPSGGQRVGALHLPTGSHHVEALIPHFAAVADVVSRRLQLGLTSRERDILCALAQGHTNADISARECVSVRTVTTHVEAIFRKLGVTNRVQAARIAFDCAMVAPQHHSAGLASAQGRAAS